jgi:hypothetical protein
MKNLCSVLLSLCLVIGYSSFSVAQLNLLEAEKIAAETGRTIFVIAGKKT